MHARLFSLLPVFALFMLGTSQVDQAERASLEKARLEELHRTAEHIRDIIIRKDILALLGYVEHMQGYPSFEETKRDLYNPKSLSYGNLFDSAVLNSYVRGKKTLISVRDYLLRAKNVRILVGFGAVGEDRLNWGYVVYSSTNFRKRSWRKAMFFYSKGRWWLRDMFADEDNWED